jgi:hypothetical protein
MEKNGTDPIEEPLPENLPIPPAAIATRGLVHEQFAWHRNARPSPHAVHKLEILAGGEPGIVSAGAFEQPSPNDLAFSPTDAKAYRCSASHIRIEESMHDTIAHPSFDRSHLDRRSKCSEASVASFPIGPLGDRLPEQLPLGWNAIGIEKHQRLAVCKASTVVATFGDCLPTHVTMNHNTICKGPSNGDCCIGAAAIADDQLDSPPLDCLLVESFQEPTEYAFFLQCRHDDADANAIPIESRRRSLPDCGTG